MEKAFMEDAPEVSAAVASELKLLSELIGETYSRVMSCSKMSFMSYIGTLIDNYGMAHGMNSEEIIGMTTEILSVQADVHKVMGISGCEGAQAQ